VVISPGPQDAVTLLAAELVRHARLLHVVKSQIGSRAPQGLDGAAIGLLMQLARCGPRRQGELADVAMLDPSTVSRYVGQLVRKGLAERRPHPDDGRAVVLVATAAGQAVAEDMIARRNEVFRTVLADWPDDDVRALTALVTRLNDDVESRRHLIARAGPAVDAVAVRTAPQPEEN
jgi:DNA-binding MarR family transcriptional regulator